MAENRAACPAAAVDERILAVVVVYGRAWHAAAAVPMLERWRAAADSRLHGLLIWDNSPRPLAAPAVGQGVHYVHDPGNGGTRAAYHHAVAIAQRDGHGWILLVDQDTVLPEAFAAAAQDAIATASGVGALVPRVRHDDVLVSPARIVAAARVVPRPLSPHEGADAGIPTAIASGTLLRTHLLASILPIPAVYWLDYLDHWVFLQLHRRGVRVGSIDCELAHHLSVNDPARMSEQRFSNVLAAEQAFVRELGGAGAGYRLRLLVRALKLAKSTPGFARRVLRAAFGGSS